MYLEGAECLALCPRLKHDFIRPEKPVENAVIESSMDGFETNVGNALVFVSLKTMRDRRLKRGGAVTMSIGRMVC
jgi:hypothetical protein